MTQTLLPGTTTLEELENLWRAPLVIFGALQTASARLQAGVPTLQHDHYLATDLTAAIAHVCNSSLAASGLEMSPCA